VKVKISHPDKLLFPDDGITKGALADYYERVADWILPHIRERPVSMQRFPAGITGKGFFHKDVPDYFPEWVKRVEVPKAGGTVTHATITSADSLLYLVNQNTITPHIWLARADRPHQPDRIVFDLDPDPGTEFNEVRRAARLTGELVRELGLVPFAQVTGSKGIHVWVPVRRGDDNDALKTLARDAADTLAERHPDELTTEWRKAKRGGRILVDTARNGYAQTAVPPYAVRPRPGAPVAVPIEWEELSDSRLRSDRWTIRTVLRRLEAKGDPWQQIAKSARATGPPRRRLSEMRPPSEPPR
jgi:bifunctional non-homologous end joining protein LigD